MYNILDKIFDKNFEYMISSHLKNQLFIKSRLFKIMYLMMMNIVLRSAVVVRLYLKVMPILLFTKAIMH